MGWITVVIRFLMMIGRIGRSAIERGRKRMRRDDVGFVTVVTRMAVVVVAMSVQLRIMRWWSTQRFRYRRSGRCSGGWTGSEI